MGFFASPAKPWLVKKLKARNQETKPKLKDSDIAKEKYAQIMGLPKNPARDVDEAVQEIREEVEVRRRKGMSGINPTMGEDTAFAREM